ncbi:MFS transporter [Amycolatopsis sp. NBC_00438]|uniref:MFS transporter n=1 Tax=Amycolatopsis sp. NBC_00438 TaxID=2903558 RepID=UPI002E1DAAD1
MTAWRETSSDGRALLVTVLLTGLTTFMFLPLLAIELTGRGVAVGEAGFLVGLLAFSGQAFSLLTGFLVDRFGPRAVMAAGFALRIAGYVLLGVGGGGLSASLVGGVVTVGVGGSLLGLAIKTRLVAEDGVGPRAMLALRSTFVNIGVVAGPALGAVVYPLGFRYILAACVLSHLILGVRLLARPGAAAARPRPATLAPEPPDGRWGRAHWLTLLGLGVTYWAIYSQLNVVVPIAALAMTGSTAAIAVVFTVNGVLVVLCQYALLRHVFARAANRTLLALGFLAFACAYAVLLAHAGWFSLLVFALPVTVAEMLIGPSLDEQAIRASSVRRTGIALGAMSAAGAVGSLAGASLGGYLVQLLSGNDVWLVLIGVSVIAAVTSLLLPKARVRHA